MVTKKAVCTFNCLFVRSSHHFCIHGVQRAREEKGTCVCPKNTTLSVDASEVYLNLRTISPSGKSTASLGLTQHFHFWWKLQKELLTVSDLILEVIYYLWWKKKKKDKEVSFKWEWEWGPCSNLNIYKHINPNISQINVWWYPCDQCSITTRSLRDCNEKSSETGYFHQSKV